MLLLLTYLNYSLIFFKRKELRTTEIEEKDIATAAKIGANRPKAARGIPIVL
jgi:hypothetical protein